MAGGYPVGTALAVPGLQEGAQLERCRRGTRPREAVRVREVEELRALGFVHDRGTGRTEVENPELANMPYEWTWGNRITRGSGAITHK